MRSEIQIRKVPAALHALLEGVVDYAGLFPPANLSLERALKNYSAYHAGPHPWMLGRFIVQASRLPEVASSLQRLDANKSRWKLSALIKEFDADMEKVAAFNRELGSFATVDSVELAPELQGELKTIPRRILREFLVYFEIPLAASIEQLQEIAREGARAKARTGGIKPEAIPPATSLASFVVNCVRAGVRFKATAGLHHPIRSQRPLTYEANAVKGNMHGFINLLIAACFALSGESADFISEILSDRDPSSFLFADAEVRWKQKSIPASLLQKTRDQLFISFGSCSFDEPVEDLMSLGWL